MSWESVNLALLPERAPVRPELGGVGFIYPGKRHVFSGPPESAKTIAVYAIALEEVRRDGAVALIDFEMGQWDALRLLREMGASDSDLSRLDYFEPDTPATEEAMNELVDRSLPSLVIVDSAAGAYDLQGLDDNKRADAEAFARIFVRPFWLREVATIVIDHVVKSSENRGRFAIGSERKVGGADVHLGFETVTPLHRGGTGVYRLVTHKDRGGYLARPRAAMLELRSDPETHCIAWQFSPPGAEHVDDWRPTVLMERISRYLEAQSEEVTRSAIYRDVKGKREYLSSATGSLVGDGFVSEREGNRGSRLIRSVKPYRDPFPAVPDPSPNAGTTTGSPVPPVSRRGTGNGSSEELEETAEDALDLIVGKVLR